MAQYTLLLYIHEYMCKKDNRRVTFLNSYQVFNRPFTPYNGITGLSVGVVGATIILCPVTLNLGEDLLPSVFQVFLMRHYNSLIKVQPFQSSNMEQER